VSCVFPQGFVEITASFVNKHELPLQDFHCKAAVPKWCQLQIFPPSQNTIPGNSGAKVIVLITVRNFQDKKVSGVPGKCHAAQKAIKIRLHVEGTRGGEKLVETVDVSKFPVSL